MRGKLTTTACGLMLTAALAIPAAAQAAVTHQGPADTHTTTATRNTTYACATIYDVGNKHYAGHDGSNGYIAFNADLANAIPFCYEPDALGQFWIAEEVNGQPDAQACLTGIPENFLIGETPCEAGLSSPTLWVGRTVGTYHSQTEWNLQDAYSGGCLYDNTQHPAIEAACHSSDAFEQFVFDALPT